MLGHFPRELRETHDFCTYVRRKVQPHTKFRVSEYSRRLSEETIFNTPVALIIYNRPYHVERLLSSLRARAPKRLFVIADGPKDNPTDRLNCLKTREALRGIDWPCEQTYLFADSNMGLRKRVLSGLDAVFKEVDECIILEDDCLVNPSFFEFAEELLQRYRDSEAVSLISALNFAPTKGMTRNTYFAYSGALIWGWATWARVWREFRDSPQRESWSELETEAVRATYPSRLGWRSFSQLMKNARTLNTWDVSFEVHLRQLGKYSIIPCRNLVTNIGFGKDATHTKFDSFEVKVPTDDLEFPLDHPERLQVKPRRERQMWIRRKAKWLWYPILHPYSTLKSFFDFLLLNLGKSKS